MVLFFLKITKKLEKSLFGNKFMNYLFMNNDHSSRNNLYGQTILRKALFILK